MERFKSDERELGALTLNFFANVRIVIVFFLFLRWLCTGARRKPDTVAIVGMVRAVRANEQYLIELLRTHFRLIEVPSKLMLQTRDACEKLLL
jgi:hypothetical protein